MYIRISRIRIIIIGLTCDLTPLPIPWIHVHHGACVIVYTGRFKMHITDIFAREY